MGHFGRLRSRIESAEAPISQFRPPVIAVTSKMKSTAADQHFTGDVVG